jgi:hypothetical protein
MVVPTKHHFAGSPPAPSVMMHHSVVFTMQPIESDMVFETSAFAGAMRSLNEYREFASWIPGFYKGQAVAYSHPGKAIRRQINGTSGGRRRASRSEQDAFLAYLKVGCALCASCGQSARRHHGFRGTRNYTRTLRWYCSQLNEHESVPYKNRLVDLFMLLVSSTDLAQVYGLSEPSHFEDGNADPYVPVGYYITSWHQADEGECEDLPGSDFAMRLVSAAIAGRCFMVSNILPHSDESLLHSIYFLGCGPQDLQAGDVIRSSHKDETALFLRPRVTDTRYSAMAILYTLALKVQTRR